MSSFNVLNDEGKIKRRQEREKNRQEAAEAQMKEKLSLDNDEVKGRNWADVSDDDSEAEVAKVPSDLASTSSEEEVESPCHSPSPKQKHELADLQKAAAAKPKAEPAKTLSKKEKAAQKKAELDDLDSIMAELGVAQPKAEANGEAQGKKKKKKEPKAAEEGSPEPAPAVPAAGYPPAPAVELTDAEKAANLEALKKKAAAGAKGGKKKPDAKAVAAAEAKKRAANAPKTKKDKKDMGYDR